MCCSAMQGGILVEKTFLWNLEDVQMLDYHRIIKDLVLTVCTYENYNICVRHGVRGKPLNCLIPTNTDNYKYSH